jgi:serine/threonine-protein kinase
METTPANALPPGTTFGRYQIVRLIGAGGMGVVYEALHTELNKRVAVKILPASVAKLPEWRARFLREGTTAASIHHPHVAEVFDVGERDGLLFLVMELLEGETLSALLEREARLPVKRAVDLLLPVCAALSVAHEQGVVHRDLKPDNIYLATSRHGGLQPKLLDFGISKTAAVEPRITNADALLGTPNYMSPEQASSRDVDARADQYALGVVLYECTTGRRPFDGTQLYPLLHSIVKGDAPRPREVCPELPPEFEAIIVRCMALDPAARFPDVDALGRALLDFASRTARGIWQPVFGDESTPALPLSVVPAEPLYAMKTQPDLRPELIAMAMRARSLSHGRGVPVVAILVALALGLAGATLIAVARHPPPTVARHAPATVARPIAAAPAPAAALRAEPVAVAPAPPPVVAAAPSVESAVVEAAPAPAPRPRTSGRARPSSRLLRGPNGAPIVE